MPLVLKDRVRETTTSTGTGTITLAGAVSGFQSFSAIGNGNTTYYAIIDSVNGTWEVGIGTYTSAGTTLSRTTVLSSSNGGSLVTFAAGTKDVICTQPSARAIYGDATNNVGVGVTPSTWSSGDAIEVGFAGNALWGFSANEAYLTNNLYYDAGFKYASANPASHFRQYQGTHAWWTAASGAAGTAASMSLRMLLDNSGNLGIGGISPSAPLHVKGNGMSLLLEGNTSGHTYMAFYPRSYATGRKAYIGFAGNGDQVLSITNEDAGSINYTVSSSTYIHSFRVGSNERANIQDWGLQVTGNAVIGNGRTGEIQLAMSNNIRYLYHFLASDGNNIGVYDFTAGWTRYYCDVNGNFWIRGTLTQNSDERLKTNWQPLAVDFVTQLAGVKNGAFDRVDAPGRQYVGVSAQSMQTVLPQSVIKDKDTDMLAVDYGSAALVSAVELAKKVVEQEQRIARLEAIIERLTK